MFATDRKECSHHTLASAAPERSLQPSLKGHLKSYCQWLPCQYDQEHHILDTQKSPCHWHKENLGNKEQEAAIMLAAGTRGPSLIYWLQNKWGLKREECLPESLFDLPFKMKIKPLHVERTLSTYPTRSQHQAPRTHQHDLGVVAGN